MTNSQRVIDDAIRMSMLYLNNKLMMTNEFKRITAAVVREHLTSQDLRTYSTFALLRYLNDIVSDYHENQKDLEADQQWEE